MKKSLGERRNNLPPYIPLQGCEVRSHLRIPGPLICQDRCDARYNDYHHETRLMLDDLV